MFQPIKCKLRERFRMAGKISSFFSLVGLCLAMFRLPLFGLSDIILLFSSAGFWSVEKGLRAHFKFNSFVFFELDLKLSK